MTDEEEDHGIDGGKIDVQYSLKGEERGIYALAKSQLRNFPVIVGEMDLTLDGDTECTFDLELRIQRVRLGDMKIPDDVNEEMYLAGRVVNELNEEFHVSQAKVDVRGGKWQIDIRGKYVR